MLRTILGLFGFAFLLSLAASSGLLPAGLAHYARIVSSFIFSLFCPLALMLVFLVPGWFDESLGAMRSFGTRLFGQREQIEDLKRKIAHMDKPHHMLQLGQVYLKQGRWNDAQHWLEGCLAREPEQLEAVYALAQCRFARGEYPAAAELLERVHVVRPEHDYGLAYLRLAQAQHRAGDRQRAAAVLVEMLRFYPGHPEATYEYALVRFEQGDLNEARKLMDEVITSVRLSPGFQRRRNRHWALKARLWLWRHRATA